jgi:hypothetical protein
MIEDLAVKLSSGFQKVWRLSDAETIKVLNPKDLLLKDRIKNLIEIRYLLDGLFRSEDTENRWLREPTNSLGDRTPMEMIQSGSMESLIDVRDWVFHISGLL